MFNPNRVGHLEPRLHVRPRKFRRSPISGDDRDVSFWTRLGAMVTDAFVAALAWFLVAIIVLTVSYFDTRVLVPVLIVFAPLYALAVILLSAFSGQSPGKAIAGIKVVRTNGMDMGIGTGLLRETIGKVIAALPLIVPLGFLWVLFDDENRGWHDKIADTKVIRVR